MIGRDAAGPAGGAVRLVRADNPGPMTLEGTNTWLVGTGRVLVVDPGPADAAHLRAVLDEAGDSLAGVLVTHRHPDHADALGHPLLQRALETAGATVLAVDPALGADPTPAALAAASDEPVELVPVPGHTDDSVALVLPDRHAVLTGDTVLGRGTSVVAHPEGDLGDHLASLRRLRGVAADGTWHGLPGHGPLVDDLAARLAELLLHREGRVRQVQDALALLGRPGGTPDPSDDGLVDAVVAHVYPDVDDPVLVGAAARTVRATLVHLARRGATS